MPADVVYTRGAEGDMPSRGDAAEQLFTLPCPLTLRSAYAPIVSTTNSEPAHNDPYVALLLYLWVVWRPLKWVAACLLLGYWAVATPKTTGASKRGAEQQSMGALETELTRRCRGNCPDRRESRS